MNLCEKTSQISVQALFSFVRQGASPQTLPDGTFAKTSWGAMKLRCIGSDPCFASYENGTAFVYFSGRCRDANYQQY